LQKEVKSSVQSAVKQGPDSTDYQIIECNFAGQGESVLSIFNQVILSSTALYEYDPRTLTQIEHWFEAKAAGNFPVLGMVNDSAELLAFGTFGSFRAYPAFKYTLEHSVYVAEEARGRGLGRAMIQALIERATAADYHALIGAIDSANLSSCKLHQSLGFERVGTLPQVGYKFGRWLDLALYQLTLKTPLSPVDG